MMAQGIVVHGPESVTVKEGDFALFPCFIDGTIGEPFWCIGDGIYTIQDLPDKHSFFNWTLTVQNVELSDNGTKYQCLLNTVSSHIAILTVVEAMEGS